MVDSINIFVCGDIVNLIGNDAFIGQNLAEEINHADFAIGNLEGAEFKVEQGVPKCPAQTAGTISYLSEVGFDMMLLANNHITDLGADQMRYTIDRIEQEGMYHIGAGFSWEDTYKPVIVDIKGKKFGFINICEAQVGQMLSSEQQFGYAWMGYSQIFDDIRCLSVEVDKVIVFVHAGLEHYSLPLPEIRSFYRRICDAGASAVIGGHPHIVQGYECYGNSFIAYSLGNFFFPHSSVMYENENRAFSLLLEFTCDGRIVSKVIHHTQKGGKVEVESDLDKQVKITKLCSLLENNYESHANEMCLKAYQGLCRKLLVQSLCGEEEPSSKIEIFKSIIRRTLFRKKYINSTKQHRDKQLLRLFENETYRYTIIRALKYLNK